jgi:DNA topoisomerase-1
MSPAVYDTTTVDFELRGASGRDYLFRSTGSIVKFQGFTRLYLETRESGEHRRLDDLEPLPELAPEDLSETEQIEPRQHFTQPPPRFSEASLVKELEKLGIGRPSTYADTIGKIRDKDYVELEKKRFHPTDLGEVVTKLLVRILPNIFDVEFTSRMENELDRVEDGEVKWHGLLADFYPGFRERLEDGQENSDQIIKEILAAEGETCEQCGQPMLVKWTKSGRFLGCSAYPECKGKRSMDGIPPEGIELGLHPAEGRQVRLKTGRYGPFLELEVPEEGTKPKRVSLPEKMSPSEVDLEYAVKLLDDLSAEGIELGLHPEEDRTVRVKDGPYGPYVELEAPGEGTKPKRVSLPEKMSSSEVDLEYAVKLLELPRTVGEDPNTGEEVAAGLGRYGPFVRRGKTFANLKSFDAMWTVTLEEALGLIDAKAAGKKLPLKEFGKHPDTGMELVLLSGRYGPYVTDGKINATLPKGVEVEEVDVEMAIDLLEKKKASRGKKKGRGRSKK